MAAQLIRQPGLPIVSTDCLSGASEVRVRGRGGVLAQVADECTSAKAIVTVLSNNDLRDRLGLEALRRVVDFEAAGAVASYELLVRDVCANRSYARELK